MSFYVLNNHRFDDDDYAICEKVKPVSLSEGDDCDLCGSPITPMKWLPPYLVRVSKKRLGDFIFGSVNPFLVSQKFKDLYESGGFKGIERFSQVELFFRRQPLEAVYYFPHIPYNYNNTDFERSGIKNNPATTCPRCQHGGKPD